MFLFIVVLILFIIVLLLILLHYRREIVRLTRQLDVIRRGARLSCLHQPAPRSLLLFIRDWNPFFSPSGPAVSNMRDPRSN